MIYNLIEFARMIFLVFNSVFTSFERIEFVISVGEGSSFNVNLFQIIIGFLVIDFCYFIFYKRSMGRE